MKVFFASIVQKYFLKTDSNAAKNQNSVLKTHIENLFNNAASNGLKDLFD